MSNRKDSNSSSTSQQLERLFKSAPRPLINHELKLVILWNPKCGCTFISKWFFHHLGHLKAALDYNPWIHNYRIEVFQKSEYLKKVSIKEVLNYRFIKVIRNPFERTISSYIHFLKMINAKHKGAIDLIPDNKYVSNTYSFSEFLTLLEATDLKATNSHWKPQLHPLEIAGLGIDFEAIQLNAMQDFFQRLELDLGLPKSDLAGLQHSSHHTTSDNTSNEISFVGDKKFDLKVAENRPEYSQFLSDTLNAKICKIYEQDFKKYKFETTY